MQRKTLSVAMPTSSFLPNLGGAEVGLHNMARRLIDRGHRPVVMAPAPHVTLLEEKGWALPYPVAALPPKIWTILRRMPQLGFWLLDRYFARAQARHRFDVWHCTMGYPTGVALVHFAQRQKDIRYLIRCAGEDIQRDPNIGYGARLDNSVDRIVREFLPRAQILVAISDSVADEYQALGVPDSRIAHIPNGVDLGRFSSGVDRRAVRERYGIPTDTFLFLSVGRIHPKKNYPALLDAAARLASSHDGFHVAIAGKNAQQLSDQRRLLGLISRVTLIEEIGNDQYGATLDFPAQKLIDLYRAADVFVFPSLVETFGIAIVEAMAARLPVIVGNSPGCRDIVRQGRDGIMVSPHDTAALAAEMASLKSDTLKRDAYVAKSTARSQDFSWESVVDRYVDQYFALQGANG